MASLVRNPIQKNASEAFFIIEQIEGMGQGSGIYG
jgi:hypothetical protein